MFSCQLCSLQSGKIHNFSKILYHSSFEMSMFLTYNVNQAFCKHYWAFKQGLQVMIIFSLDLSVEYFIN